MSGDIFDLMRSGAASMMARLNDINRSTLENGQGAEGLRVSLESLHEKIDALAVVPAVPASPTPPSTSPTPPPEEPTDPEIEELPAYDLVELYLAPIASISAPVGNGSVGNINKLPDAYPHGWYAEGDSVEMDVDLHEELSLDRVSLLMHSPSAEPRTYTVSLGGEPFALVDSLPSDTAETARYELRLPSVETDGFALIFGGNDREGNDWNGVYRVEVYTSSDITVKTKAVDVELPANAFDQWPMNAESADFRTKYNALSGYHLMNQGRDFVKNFRYLFGHDGRQTTVTNQPEFDAARSNGDFGVIIFISDKPVVLIDRRRDHSSVQLLVCDTLSFVRTWGNLAIDCDAVSAPQGGGANVIAHGSNVLYSKAKGAVIEHTWADMTVEPPSPRLIRNVVSQGGARKGHYSAGAERVSFGVSAWTSNWEQHWDNDIQQRDFDLNTEAVGMQGSEDVDAGADTMQPLEMIDWLDPAKSNHPHGIITNSSMFAIGVLAAVTKAKWNPALGEGEQGIDGKAADGFDVLDSLFSGFMVNKVGSNSSWGGGVFSSHFNVNGARVARCAGSNQHRHIEIGSGDTNLIEECLFADTQAAYDYVTGLGHDAGGQQDIVAYRETRYPWAAHGHTTAVQARNNVYDHTPRHSAVGLTVENEIVTDPRFNVYKDFGELGAMLIGTTDPRAKGSIWYAG